MIDTPTMPSVFSYLALPGLMEPESVLVLNANLGTLIQLSHRTILVEQQFPAGELRFLLPILESYPHYCPYETLLALHTYTQATEAQIDQCRALLHQARENGEADFHMRPVRNVIARARLRLREFGIDITSLLEVGYILRSITRTLR